MIDLSGKTAIITGAARGIGKAIALVLAKSGANIVINDIMTAKETAEATIKELEALGTKAIIALGDVRSAQDTINMVKTAVDTFGRVDILVNNAGITRDAMLMRMSEEDWDLVLDINLKGAFNCTKAVLKPMMKAKSGVIINISSVVGVMGNASQVNYAASKAGLIGFTKSVAKEYSSRSIRVNAVAPGFIKSDMTDKLSDEIKESYFKSIPLARFGETEDVANAVCFLASNLAKYITGQVLHIDGGLIM